MLAPGPKVPQTTEPLKSESVCGWQDLLVSNVSELGSKIKAAWLYFDTEITGYSNA
jgi:hypothetical protein